jgi:hypothetical protein
MLTSSTMHDPARRTLTELARLIARLVGMANLQIA